MSTPFLASGEQSLNWMDYRKLCELEQVELDKVKWLESERLSFDCGYERAEWIWITRHRDKWIAALKASGVRLE